MLSDINGCSLDKKLSNGRVSCQGIRFWIKFLKICKSGRFQCLNRNARSDHNAVSICVTISQKKRQTDPGSSASTPIQTTLFPLCTLPFQSPTCRLPSISPLHLVPPSTKLLRSESHDVTHLSLSTSFHNVSSTAKLNPPFTLLPWPVSDPAVEADASSTPCHKSLADGSGGLGKGPRVGSSSPRLCDAERAFLQV